MIRVALPFHLRNLAHVGTEVEIEVKGPVTQRSVLDALEAKYPMMRGTIRVVALPISTPDRPAGLILPRARTLPPAGSAFHIRGFC